ncbi:amino acid ABC transporter substrate-binding protein (PAAT family) [Aestuariispira insulae]|uniref:Amino acid ABC transporter substrate-binding protein (PAAT family) n=2 Tax=Aestuariispira insulae TaxID=1461337 RepID=A0A3D9HX69_9PROT|nr:amino acid ABC transporter substrate-binding protein (PAAT family) [Aestuariispira insulae]
MVGSGNECVMMDCMKTFLLFLAVWIGCMSPVSARLLLVTLDYPPYEYMEDGEARGLAVNVVREVFRRLDEDIEIQSFPWARSLKMVELGNADAIFTAYRTSEREAFLDYSSEVLMPQEVSLFVRNTSKIETYATLADLADQQFAARHGVSYGQAFDRAVTDGTIANIHRVSDGDTVIRLLMNGRADVVVFNRLGGIYRFRSLGVSDQVRELQPPLQSVPSYIAFSKKNRLANLRDRVDATLRAMKEDGTYQALTVYQLIQ